jgi:Holliday junction DNA helicase RuvB
MNIRPQTLEAYIGQEALRPLLKAAITNSNKTGKQFPHSLGFGSPGIGKTTLARVLCNELEGYEWVSLTGSKELTAPMLRKLLLNLDVRGYGEGGKWQPGAKRYLVFIDEISELKLSVWESVLYNAMEDFEVHDESGTTFWLPDWTLFAATTAPYSLPPPGLSRFGLKLHLQSYSIEELGCMIKRLYPLKSDIVEEIARRSRGIARLALNYAEGVNDYGLSYFDVARIDDRGLTDLDRSYLAALESAKGRGMSLQSIASVVRESPRTLSTFVEPELLRLDMIRILPHIGRVLVEVGRGAKVRV